jgi:hypothetical protein
MQIILHIGLEKTGTSSLQKFCALNRDKLRQHGFLYSVVAGADSHTALAAAAQAEDKFDDLRMIHGLDSADKIRSFRMAFADKLDAEAASSCCSTLILSSEHCSSRLITAVEVEALAKILHRISDDITILVYLRRQDDFLCSSYSTDVKSGFTGAISLPSDQLREERYNYEVLLQRWSSVFGRNRITCRLYATDKLKNGDIVDDFIEAIGIPPSDEFQKPPRVNEGLNIEALEFLRIFNAHVPPFKDGRQNKKRGNVAHLLQLVSNGPSPGLPPARLAEFMRKFRRSNAAVAQEYFGQVAPAGDPLFGEPPAVKSRAEMRSIDAEEAILLAARIWERKQEQVVSLNHRIEVLEKRLAQKQRV